MGLRKLYSVLCVMMVVAVSSCSTQSHLSHVKHLSGTVAPAPLSTPASSVQPAVAAPAKPPVSSMASPATAAKSIETRPSLSISERSERARVKKIRDTVPRNFVVRTTAYSHQERDSWKYGKSNAAGGVLKHGEEQRSAAADWSRFPLGTRFKIDGLPQEYVVEDYGRALVGSDTIDIYKPSLSSMKKWGTRHVGIEVLEWGSFSESERILKSRVDSAPHVRQMLEVIQQKIIHIPAELRDGFSV